MPTKLSKKLGGKARTLLKEVGLVTKVAIILIVPVFLLLVGQMIYNQTGEIFNALVIAVALLLVVLFVAVVTICVYDIMIATIVFIVFVISKSAWMFFRNNARKLSNGRSASFPTQHKEPPP